MIFQSSVLFSTNYCHHRYNHQEWKLREEYYSYARLIVRNGQEEMVQIIIIFQGQRTVPTAEAQPIYATQTVAFTLFPLAFVSDFLLTNDRNLMPVNSMKTTYGWYCKKGKSRSNNRLCEFSFGFSLAGMVCALRLPVPIRSNKLEWNRGRDRDLNGVSNCGSRKKY